MSIAGEAIDLPAGCITGVGNRGEYHIRFGVAGASLRVYVNIGMCSDIWLTLFDPVEGTGGQKRFSIERARNECADFRATEERMPAAEAFLTTIGPMHLKDAPGGAQYDTPFRPR